MININKLNTDGFVVIKNIIPRKHLTLFNKEINSIEQELQLENNSKNKKFIDTFSKSTHRSRVYLLMQNLKSIRKITEFVENYLYQQKLFKSLDFKNISINNGLIISLPKERDFLNPLHQDIYYHHSSKHIKLWIPMTRVNKIRGSMEVFKGSHNLGFINPKYKNKKSTYPEIDKKFLNRFKGNIFNLNALSIVIFYPQTIHKSAPNLSGKARFSIGVDIQDISFPQDEDLLKKLKFIKNERTKRRKKN